MKNEKKLNNKDKAWIIEACCYLSIGAATCFVINGDWHEATASWSLACSLICINSIVSGKYKDREINNLEQKLNDKNLEMTKKDINTTKINRVLNKKAKTIAQLQEELAVLQAKLNEKNQGR